MLLTGTERLLERFTFCHATTTTLHFDKFVRLTLHTDKNRKKYILVFLFTNTIFLRAMRIL